MNQVYHNGDPYVCINAHGGGDMTKPMTVVFHDEELYTCLKVEAARRHNPASDIVAEAVREWLERQEDMELLPVIEAARAVWQERGGRPCSTYGWARGLQPPPPPGTPAGPARPQ